MSIWHDGNWIANPSTCLSSAHRAALAGPPIASRSATANARFARRALRASCSTRSIHLRMATIPNAPQTWLGARALQTPVAGARGTVRSTRLGATDEIPFVVDRRGSAQEVDRIDAHRRVHRRAEVAHERIGNVAQRVRNVTEAPRPASSYAVTRCAADSAVPVAFTPNAGYDAAAARVSRNASTAMRGTSGPSLCHGDAHALRPCLGDAHAGERSARDRIAFEHDEIRPVPGREASRLRFGVAEAGGVVGVHQQRILHVEPFGRVVVVRRGAHAGER